MSISDSQTPEPELVDIAPATTVVIRGRVPMAELAQFFDRSFHTLSEFITRHQVAVLGPAFGLYHGQPGETVDLEVGFATDDAVDSEGEVSAGSLPGGRVARCIHAGSFDQLGSSWGRLGTWIQQQGLRPSNDLWEVYITEPRPDMDPAELRTELNWPIAP